MSTQNLNNLATLIHRERDSLLAHALNQCRAHCFGIAVRGHAGR